MDRIGIYDKASNLIAEVVKLEFSGELMGIPKVTTTIMSPVPIELKAGDYLDFRGERYTLGSKPNVKKVARKFSYGEAFQYEDVVFFGVADELTRCKFLDVVPEELIDLNGDPVVDADGNTIVNSLHYTSLPDFSFYAEGVKQLQERLQANLDRLYTGDKRWRVKVAEGTQSRPYNFTFSNESCWGALCQVNEIWELSFIIRGREITIGAAGDAVNHVFTYGKGNGLREVNEENDEDALVVTRLRAYGSTRNIPYRYYNKLWRNRETGEIKYFKEDPPYVTDRRTGKQIYNNYERLLSESMYMPNLMLPVFTRGTAMDGDGNVLNIGDTDKTGERDIFLGGEQGKDAWLQSSEMVEDYGINEDIIYFDQEDETGKDDDDIYPSIEKMTQAQLAAAGVACDLDAGDNGHLDEVVDAEQMTDDGILPDPELEDPLVGTFTITLKDLGFDINDYLTGDTAQISMKSGQCVGRTFDITEVVKQGNKYVLTCGRIIDNDLQLAFPYRDYNVKAGDKFVLLHIYMPEVYVFAAEQRLYERAKRYILENDHNKGVYSPTIDNIFLKRHPEIAATIREGDIFSIEDEDLGLRKSVTISSLTIRVGESMVEEYDVTLSEDNDADLVTRVAESVSKNIFTSNVSRRALETLIDQQGDSRYLSKRNDDEAAGRIVFKQGIGIGEDYGITSKGEALLSSASSSRFTEGWLGSGFRLWMQNELSKLEVDSLTVRRVMNVAELLIHKVRAVGGEIIVSAADGKVAEVSGNKVTLEDANGDGVTMFQVGDYVRCQRWQGSDIYGYWLQVTEVDGLTLTLDTANRLDGRQDLPHVGDEIVLLGSSDSERQGAVRISATEGGVPVVDVLDGISSPTMDNTLKARLGGLDGIQDSAFGNNQPQGYGLYSNNAYLKGVLVLSNGDDVGTRFSVLESGLQSVVSGINEDSNFFANGTFKEGLAYWDLVRNTQPTTPAMKLGDNVYMLNGALLSLGSSVVGSMLTTKDARQCLFLAHRDELSQSVDIDLIADQDALKMRLDVFCPSGTAITILNNNSDYAFDLTTEQDGWQTLTFDLTTEFYGKAFGDVFTISASDDVYLGGLWLGTSIESKIEQSASKISLSITEGLKRTGIDIESEKIRLTADKVEVSDDLEVGRLLTNNANGGQVKIQGSLLEVFGGSYCNIRFGVDDNGYAIMQYLDRNGDVLYDLGPNGLSHSEVVEEKTIGHGCSSTYNGGVDNTFYEYCAKRNVGVIVGGTIVSDTDQAKTYDHKWFRSASIHGGNYVNGTYYDATINSLTNIGKYGELPIGDILPQRQSDGTEWDSSVDANDNLTYPIHWRTKYDIANGVVTSSTYYWQDK